MRGQPGALSITIENYLLDLVFNHVVHVCEPTLTLGKNSNPRVSDLIRLFTDPVLQECIPFVFPY